MHGVLTLQWVPSSFTVLEKLYTAHLIGQMEATYARKRKEKVSRKEGKGIEYSSLEELLEPSFLKI